MNEKKQIVACGALVFLTLFVPGVIEAKPSFVNARSAILYDTSNGRVLYEQDADLPIAPASVTKILTLYIVLDAIENGRLHLWDKVTVSKRAATTGGSRMSLRAGEEVSLEELIKGIAVVSGNDAAVAVAEHMSGSVEEFVRLMNRKARQLGMTNSFFMTPNGLPSKAQVSTARDLAKLSMAYLRRYPDSLSIHSMRSYTHGRATHRNANRLLGTCPGVDGLKTGFVCASGYNISATASRGDTRLLAVVLGATSASVRATETAKLLEMGFQMTCPGCPETGVIASQNMNPTAVVSRPLKNVRTRTAETKKSSVARTVSKAGPPAKISVSKSDGAAQKASAVTNAGRAKKSKAAKPQMKKGLAQKQPVQVVQTASTKAPQTVKKPGATKKTASAKVAEITDKQQATKKTTNSRATAKPIKSKQKQASPPPINKNETVQKSRPQVQDSKARKG